MKFAYSAYDRAGKVVAESIEAATLADAEELLRRKGLFISTIRALEGAARSDRGDATAVGRFGGRGRRLRDMALFVRQLSVLVSTGTPMVDAITSLERQLPQGAWRTALGNIRARVEEGSPFSVALELHPEYFDGVARSLVAAGESGGQLDAMLKRLAALTRQQLKVRSSIVGALAYPCVLIFISIAVLAVMLFFVLPRFEGLFQSLGSPLPPTTQLLMDLSEVLRHKWWAVLAGIAILVTVAHLYLRTAAGKRSMHVAMVSLPQLGRVSRALITARVARVLGVLLAGRVPMLEALALTRQASGNMLYDELLAKAEQSVTRGENISAAFEGSSLIPAAFVEAIRSGERSGQLPNVLLDLSDFMDEDNEIILRSLASIIEPLILMFLGVVIGFVAVSMFLPLFDLATATGGGGGR